MSRKLKVIYYHHNIKDNQFEPIGETTHDSLEGVESSLLNFVGLGGSMSKQGKDPLPEHTDPKAYSVDRIEIWETNDYEEPNKLIRRQDKQDL